MSSVNVWIFDKCNYTPMEDSPKQCLKVNSLKLSYSLKNSLISHYLYEELATILPGIHCYTTTANLYHSHSPFSLCAPHFLSQAPLVTNLFLLPWQPEKVKLSQLPVRLLYHHLGNSPRHSPFAIGWLHTSVIGRTYGDSGMINPVTHSK